MSESPRISPRASAEANGNGNGNGKHRSEAIGDPEFFLVPLLASDPLPYLFDGDGRPVNAEGAPMLNGNGISAAVKKLQEEARPRGHSADR